MAGLTSTWYPGQMARTRRLIRENLPLVGLVIEVADARAPKASRYPRLAGLVPGRPILTVLGKADLADPGATDRWVAHLRRQARPGDSAVAFASEAGPDARAVARLAAELGRRRGPLGDVRAMVVGLPNVGKSTLINRLVGRSSARTGDRPGITRGKQWLKAAGTGDSAGAGAPKAAGPGLTLLDLPGILVPGRLPARVALVLALLGLLPEPAFDAREVARFALFMLKDAGRLSPELGETAQREGREAGDLLARYALARGHLLPGGLPDTGRAAVALIRAFREGRFGRLTIEEPGGMPAEVG